MRVWIWGDVYGVVDEEERGWWEVGEVRGSVKEETDGRRGEVVGWDEREMGKRREGMC